MSKARILIVEDEAIVAEDLAQKLSRLDYEVIGVSASGEEAVARAREGRPELVLMDIRLEGKMDGVEAAGIIRRECDIAVIFLTAHSDPLTLERAKVTEPFGYILKPFEERELETHLQMALYKHQAERQLRGEREWLRVTLRSIGDAVITTDAEGRVTSLNPVAEELTGWSMAEAVGRPLTEVFNIVNEETRQPAFHPVERVLKEGKVMGLANHTALISREGKETPIEDSAAPIKDAQGRILGVVMVFHDVTEKRRVEAALRESESRAKVAEAMGRERQRFYDVLNKLPAYVALLSPDYQVPFANRFFEERFGKSNGRRCYEYLFNRREPCENCETYKVLKTNAPHGWEWTGPDGRNYEVHDFPFTDADGTEMIMEMGIDVTERKRAEAALKEANQSLAERSAKLQELVGELEHFSYTITHDMRAPLRGMQGFAEMMAEACGGCDKRDAVAFLRRIRTSAGRMDGLITDALNYSRTVRQELAVEPVDVGALLRGMLDSYPELQSTKASIELKGEIPLVMGNEAGLTQCFSNLLGNAVKFVKSGERPEICVWAEWVEGTETRGPKEGHGDTETRRHGDGEWVRIWVEDKGIGVPAPLLPRVFDMFSRGHNSEAYEGTGIGLALVRKVVQRMGGRVGVESEEGKGSRFWVELRSAE